MTRNEVINCLLDCEDRAYGYHINEKVLGFPVGQFEDVMHAAAAMLKAEPKRGRWVAEPNRERHWHCSGCGYVVGIAARTYMYCPICGSQNNMEDKA